MDYIEMDNEDFIEAGIEDTEATEAILPASILQRAPEKKKQERSQKQIESLKKAQAARTKNLAERKRLKGLLVEKEKSIQHGVTETMTEQPIVDNFENQEKPSTGNPQKRKKRRKQKIVIQQEESSSSDEDVIVIQQPRRRKAKKKQPIVLDPSSDSETDEDYNIPLEDHDEPKNDFASSFHFI